MARRRDQVPEWLWEIGKRIQDARESKGYKNQTDFAEALEEYRRVHFPDFKPFTRNDAEQLENGGKDIKAEHILSVCGVLNVSADEILTGYKPEDQNIVDEFHFSPRALIALRQQGYAGQTISFFMDNFLIEMLDELKRYLVMDVHDAPNEREQLDKIELAELQFYKHMSTWRHTYLSMNKRKALRKESANRQAEESIKEGVNQDGKKGKRGRNSKKTQA